MKIIKIISLLTLIIFAAGCNVLMEEEPLTESDGAFLVNIAINSNDRTILPALENGFSKFVITARSETSLLTPSMEVIYRRAWVSLGIPETGEWEITIIAYIEIDGIEYPVARGNGFITVDEMYPDYSIYINVNIPEMEGNGTFNYTVTYPQTASVSVKLEPLPFGEAPVINNTNAANGQSLSADVPAGIYFLTVKATANGKTVTRNEIVHIYQKAPTNANYIFTKLDFGAESLTLSGTIKILIDGKQPDAAHIQFGTDSLRPIHSQPVLVDFGSSNDGSATWSVTVDNFHGASSLFCMAGYGDTPIMLLKDIAVPLDDTDGIDLGEIIIVPQNTPSDTWINDSTSADNPINWYSFDISEGETYYLWLNNSYYGNYTKTLDANIAIYLYDSDGVIVEQSVFFYDYNLWYYPFTFTIPFDGKIVLAIGSNALESGTYAFGYSNNRNWHYNYNYY
ncbi:MAG: hypothetical protein FWD40_06330 [Treponema sp.]|nr:hypothetical protein [Treponema sp.]